MTPELVSQVATVLEWLGGIVAVIYILAFFFGRD